MTLGGGAVTFLEEPMLQFGGSNPFVDPKTGLALFGTYSAPKTPINIGIIGDKETIQQTRSLLSKMALPIPGNAKQPTLTPSFPGLSTSSPFKCELAVRDDWIRAIKSDRISELDMISTKSKRISTAVGLFVDHMETVTDRDEVPDIFICAVPRKLLRVCATKSTSSGTGDKIRTRRPRHDTGSQNLFEYLPADYREKHQKFVMETSAEDFHNLLKARAMRFVPRTQMIKPDTLDGMAEDEPGSARRKTQHNATLAWNLATALLYKSECKLWRPAHMPNNVCFVGVSFYRTLRSLGGAMGTSLAQIFTPEGEGMVLRGDEFPWASRRSPHLRASSAERLLKGALDLYTRQTDGAPPRRVVLHKSSKYSDEELAGFRKAVGKIDHDFVALLTHPGGVAVFRQGKHPVLRGTMITLPGGRCLLYTSGYVPFLGSYPGSHVPNPLEVAELIGDTPREQICKEILMLTKLNWNSANFSSRVPITLQFSRGVGEIMKEMPADTPFLRKHKYMYYM